MNCVISKNGSSLYCLFNKSNLKTDSYLNMYSIKENEIISNNENIFLVGLNKVEFIYEKGEETKGKIKIERIKIFIILIIIIVVIIILFAIIIITIFLLGRKQSFRIKK